MDFLVQYLNTAMKAMDRLFEDYEQAKNLIASVLAILCSLFDDAKLTIDQTVKGTEIHAQVHVAFLLTRGKKNICIVDVKNNNFALGEAQALIACEVVAEREEVNVVYGIVTDYLRWFFFRSGNESTNRDWTAVRTVWNEESRQREIDMIHELCETIYGVLSDGDE